MTVPNPIFKSYGQALPPSNQSTQAPIAFHPGLPLSSPPSEEPSRTVYLRIVIIELCVGIYRGGAFGGSSRARVRGGGQEKDEYTVYTVG